VLRLQIKHRGLGLCRRRNVAQRAVRLHECRRVNPASRDRPRDGFFQRLRRVCVRSSLAGQLQQPG
jgi:hypothetical protein